jgi:hypothetical protein
VVTRRQLNNLKRRLNLNLDESRVYVFDEVEGALLDQEGQKLSQNRLKEIEKSKSVIIIDDV